MPLCIFHTNVQDDVITDEIHRKLSKHAAEILKHDEQSLTIEIRSGKHMTRAANPDALWGFFEIHSTNDFHDPDRNREMGGRMIDFAVDQMRFPRTSVFCMMHEHDPKEIGIPGGKLLSDLPHYQNYKGNDYFEGLRKLPVKQ